jgi:hypothetical protein
MALSTEAAKAIKPKNTLSINTGGRHFKMRHVILQLTLDDGKVIHLRTKETRPQSVPSDWFAAEGVRLKNGQQMIWTFE